MHTQNYQISELICWDKICHSKGFGAKNFILQKNISNYCLPKIHFEDDHDNQEFPIRPHKMQMWKSIELSFFFQLNYIQKSLDRIQHLQSISIFKICSNREFDPNHFDFLSCTWLWTSEILQSHYRIVNIWMWFPKNLKSIRRELMAHDVNDKDRGNKRSKIILKTERKLSIWIINGTYPYYKHEAHRQFLHFHHQTRPLIPWSQPHDDHGEVLAVVLLD